jgi:hypothetical protein
VREDFVVVCVLLSDNVLLLCALYSSFTHPHAIMARTIQLQFDICLRKTCWAAMFTSAAADTHKSDRGLSSESKPMGELAAVASFFGMSLSTLFPRYIAHLA